MWLILKKEGIWKRTTNLCYASWANFIKTSRSTTGIVVYFEIYPIYWSSRIKTLFGHSTAESEYLASDHAARMTV